MDHHAVERVLGALGKAGIRVLLEGGWGVDALLGHQTRAHRDLDLVVDEDHLLATARCLESLGFHHDDFRKPGLPAQLIMVRDGEEVDVHPILRDRMGNGWQQLSAAGAWGLYSAEGLRGIGAIGNRLIRCTTPELQVRHRLGYPLRDEDIHDLRLLKERFDVAIHPGCDETTDGLDDWNSVLSELAPRERGSDV